MMRTVRTLFAAAAGAALFTACAASDSVAPRTMTPRELVSLSGGSTSAGGGTAIGGTGGGSTGGGSTGGGGGAKSCTNTLAVTSSATEALTGNAFQASYTLASCQSQTRVRIVATDLATGQMVWQSVADLAGTVAFWTLPYKNSTYRIDAYAVAGPTSTAVATASTIVSTMTVLPCTMLLNSTTTTGYSGITAAIWVAIDSRDCGMGDTHTALLITNLTTGVVGLDDRNLPNSTMVDFESGRVAYDTPYRIETQLVRASGDVVLRHSEDVRSSVLR